MIRNGQCLTAASEAHGFRGVPLALSGLAALGALFLAAAGAPPASAQEGILGQGIARTKPSSTEVQAKIKRLEKQVESDAKNYRLYYELGNLYADLEDITDAKANYEKAIEINPKYVEALVNLGSLLSDAQAYEDAIKRLEEALGLDPNDCKARSNLGNVYYAMGRYPDAMFEYNRAVEIDPKCYSALYNIGVAFADAGIFREAVRWWTKVVNVAPGTDAARSAQENIQLLDRFSGAPLPAAPASDH